MQVIDVTPSDDIEQAAWIAPRLRPFTSYQAGSVVPGGFDAYARIDHAPPAGREGALPAVMARRLVRILRRGAPTEMLWLAMWNGYGQMSGSVSAFWFGPGEPPPNPAPPTPPAPRDGWMQPPRRGRGAPLVRHEAREYLLYRGTPDQVAGWMDGPNLWWPDDHSWCVASEIDLPWTYVGASAEVIAEILDDGTLHARPLSLDESTLARDHPELGERP